MIDIIVLTYNHSNLTIDCLKSLKECTKTPYRIIWVDNGSTDYHYEKTLDCLINNFAGFWVHGLDENYGFSVGMNTGIKISDSDKIILINNDITFTDNWLKHLLIPFDLDPDIGIVGSVTDKISSVQQIEKIKTKKTDNEWFYTHHKGNIAFFCVAIKREVIEKIGYLDERFFNGGEDDDYNDRARMAGFKVGVGVKSFVYHKHMATRKDPELNFKESFIKNKQLLYKKRLVRSREMRKKVNCIKCKKLIKSAPVGVGTMVYCSTVCQHAHSRYLEFKARERGMIDEGVNIKVKHD